MNNDDALLPPLQLTVSPTRRHLLRAGAALAAGLSVVTGKCVAQGAAPSTAHPAKEVFYEWLAALNNRDRAAMEVFIRRYQRKYTVQDEMDLRESMGEIVVLRIDALSPEEVRVLARGSDSDNTLLISVAVSPTDPVRVITFQIEGTEPPEQFKISRLGLDAVLVQATRRLERLRDADKLAGAVLVAKGDRILLRWSGGLADRSMETPVTLCTKFRLASVGKMFTAVAVLQLIDAGKLGLDDPVGKHLDNFPNADVASKVTIRQLLTHTSGLGDIFNEEFEKISSRLRTVSDYIATYGKQQLPFTPGTQEKYSNFGYIVLGAIVEAASGLSYDAFVEKNVFKPAGMSASGFEPETQQPRGLARPYTEEDGKWVDAGPTLPWRGTPAGGGYSTVGDMLRFSQALQAGALLSAKMRDAATVGQNLKGWYGFGFMVGGRGNDARYGHEGGAAGMTAAMVVYPKSRYTVIGLGNLDPNSIAQVVNFISNRLPLDQRKQIHHVKKIAADASH